VGRGPAGPVGEAGSPATVVCGRFARRRRIRDTFRRLDRRHPSLARHLRTSVSTGTTCRYQPPVDTSWTL
jgi:hypothetical protein